VYGLGVVAGLQRMTDRLSQQDWLNQGLKTLVRNGFTALRAEPLARAMKVSRGSFYWHFADVEAFHAAILQHWRDVAVEQIIVDVEASSRDKNPLPQLLLRVFANKPRLEIAVRSWAVHAPLARRALQVVDQRRLSYVTDLLEKSGLAPHLARARAQVLYWTFLGFALSDARLPRNLQAAAVDELIRLAGVSN
jgi:AcrR family transcriptional regulator